MTDQLDYKQEYELLKHKMINVLTFVRHCISHAKGLLKSNEVESSVLSKAIMNVIDNRCNEEVLELTVEDPQVDFSSLEEKE
tara:strand:+ start:846 stop:1091 length:246 start_codon:yes stop_codon:yes gene_type:complete